MKQTIRNTVLTVAAFVAFAAPALADSACIVTAPEIRLRKSPSKKSKVVAVLKKDSLATAVGKCGGGWVKVTSKDGKLSGYVGGWALADVAAGTAAAGTTAALPAVVVKTETSVPDAAPKEIPSNESLAIQITDLRLKVLGLGRDVDAMKKDIQKIKVAVGRNARHKRPAKKS